MLKLRFLFFVFFTFQIFGQEKCLFIEIKTSDKECNNLFSAQLSYKDSIISNFEFSTCSFKKCLNLSLPEAVLKIKDLNGSNETILVKIGEENNIYLDAISFKLNQQNLDEVTITGIPKKFIEIDPEKTKITVENNPILEKNSVYDAILKIPGIIPFPNGGFAYGGQQLMIQFDGITSTIFGQDLDNLLKSLPATSVATFELISNPGASYEATFSGAILDIISQGRINKWLNGTITLNAGFNQNVKLTPSFLLNGKRKKLSWQIQSFYNYNENSYFNQSERNYQLFNQKTTFKSEKKEEGKNIGYQFRGNITYRLKNKSFIQLSSQFSKGSNNSIMENASFLTGDTIQPYLTNYNRNGDYFYLNNTIKYRLVLDSNNRKLDLTYNNSIQGNYTGRLTEEKNELKLWSKIQNQKSGVNHFLRIDIEWPFKKWKNQFNLGYRFVNYTSLNNYYYLLNSTEQLLLNKQLLNYDFNSAFQYSELNHAAYVEYKQKIGKKIGITSGLRIEDYKLNGKNKTQTTVNDNYLEKSYLNVFPSIHFLYSIFPDIKFLANFSRKINIPNPNQFDPNLNGYFDQYTQNIGSSALEPNFTYRGNTKLTVFDYLEFNTTLSIAKSIILSEVFVDSNSYLIQETQRTYNNVQTWNHYFAVPIPFGLFTQGFKFFQQQVDVDAISFVYLYANNSRTFIPDLYATNERKSQWNLGSYSQIVFPWDLKLDIDYSIDFKGKYLLIENTKNIHILDLVLSKVLKNNKWRFSISIDDILNSRSTNVIINYLPVNFNEYTKVDSRVFWFKITHSFGKVERPSLNEVTIPNKSFE